jgi:hypothetical protein
MQLLLLTLSFLFENVCACECVYVLVEVGLVKGFGFGLDFNFGWLDRILIPKPKIEFLYLRYSAPEYINVDNGLFPFFII